MRVSRSAVSALVMVFLLGVPLQAQDTKGELQIFGGAVFPLMNLADGDWFLGENRFIETAMQDNVTIGATLGYRLGRVQIEGSVGLWPTYQYIILDTGVGDVGVDVLFRTPAKVLMAGASLLYGLELGGDVAIEPFFAVGVGVKKYSVSASSDFADIFEQPTTFGGSVGFGSRFPISPTKALRVEVRDHLSFFDYEIEGADPLLQHDIVATVGFSFLIGGQ